MEDNNYRQISALAVASLLVAVLSMFAFVTPGWIPVAVAAVPLSVWARRSILRYELVGLRCANWALVLSCVIAVVTPLGWYVAYRLEADSNAIRLNFADIARDKVNLENLRGRQVMLKGYVTERSGNSSEWPQHGEAVTDFDITYNSSPNPKHGGRRILVRLPAGQTWPYDYFPPIAVTGRLESTTEATDSSVPHQFVLQDAVIRRVRTAFDLTGPLRQTGFGWPWP